jgi:hypothetical protein
VSQVYKHLYNGNSIEHDRVVYRLNEDGTKLCMEMMKHKEGSLPEPVYLDADISFEYFIKICQDQSEETVLNIIFNKVLTDLNNKKNIGLT